MLFHYCISGMDFKKNIPRAFLDLITAAQTWQRDIDEHPQADDEDLVVTRYFDDLGGYRKVSLAFTSIQEVCTRLDSLNSNASFTV